MRVVDTDNFGGDYPNEKFITMPLHEKFCNVIANALNDYVGGENASRYYKVVEDGYVLQPGFEP